MKRLIDLFVVLLMPSLVFSSVKITGKVIGADGKQPILSHVHVINFQGNIRQTLQTQPLGENGQFELQIANPGAYRVMITAVNHSLVKIPIIIDEETDNIALEAKLAPLAYKDEFDKVKIVGDWNNFGFNNADEMEKQPDGTFTYKRQVNADTLSYQLLGITKGDRSVNGTQADYFVYDGGGDYRSVVKVTGGKINIVFDPKKLFRGSDDLPEVTFSSSNKRLQKIWEIDKVVQKEQEKFMQTILEYRKSKKDMKDFTYDWSGIVAMLSNKMEKEPDLLVRKFSAIQLGSLLSYRAKIDTAILEKIPEIIPPNSLLLAANPNLPMMLIKDKEKSKQYIDKVISENPDRMVQAVAIANLAMRANYEGDKEEVKKYYTMLEKDYSDIKEIEFYLKKLDPNKRIQVGKTVPDFEVKLMGSDETVSNKNLLGKFYLIDFWAVWCGPCVGEMEHLHKAHDKFKDKITFLSISLDRKPEDVLKFRAEKWKMPWLHVFAGKGDNKKVTEIFQVMSIPKPILINPQGKILALEGQLRGENLEKTLKKYLPQ